MKCHTGTMLNTLDLFMSIPTKLCFLVSLSSGQRMKKCHYLSGRPPCSLKGCLVEHQIIYRGNSTASAFVASYSSLMMPSLCSDVVQSICGRGWIAFLSWHKRSSGH